MSDRARLAERLDDAGVDRAVRDLGDVIRSALLEAARLLADSQRESEAAEGLREQIKDIGSYRISTLNIYIWGTSLFLGLYFGRGFLSSDFVANMFQIVLPSLGVLGGLTAWNVEQYHLGKINGLVESGLEYQRRHNVDTVGFAHLRIELNFWTMTAVQKFVTMGSITWCIIAIAYFLK